MLAEKWTTMLCAVLEKTLKGALEVGRRWSIHRSTETILEVIDEWSMMVALGVIIQNGP